MQTGGKKTMSRHIALRNLQSSDFKDVIALTQRVYPASGPWNEAQLSSHLKIFPEGQFVALRPETNEMVGYAASLIIFWDDYDMHMSWRDFTDGGMFTNHDPQRGRTLYGAEIMVRQDLQGTGVGTSLYGARQKLVENRGLLRIRAGARLRGFHRYAGILTPEEYLMGVVKQEIYDPTLTFQIRRGFHVLDLVSHYLGHDPESQGYAAVIEWLNPKVALDKDFQALEHSRYFWGSPPGQRVVSDLGEK